MKRTATLLAALAVAISANAARTATEAYVTNKIAAAVAAIPAPDFTTNNVVLTNTIAQAAPFPGDYEAVSNRAMLITINPGATPYFNGQANYTYEAEHAENADIATSARSAERLTDGSNSIFYDYELMRWVITDWRFYMEPLAALSEVTAAATAATNYTDNAIAAIPAGVTPGAVTNIVNDAIREQSLGGIWDTQLEVWWTPVMQNGSLTYQATTNVNLNAEN